MFKKIVLLISVVIGTAYAQAGLTFHKASSLAQLHPLLLNAQKQHQFVMIEFRAKDCPACQDLSRQSFSNTDVQKALANYYLVEIYLTTKNRASFQKRFNVKTAPTLIFLDQGGQALPEFTTTGFVTPSQLLKLIARVNKGNEN